MATRPPSRESLSFHHTYACMLTINYSIIQDCEDALTNWVESNAAVSSKVSARSRTLSQRRSQKMAGSSGLDLSGQDQSLAGDRQSGLWVPAAAHAGQYGDEGEEDEMEEDHRGRQEEQVEA